MPVVINPALALSKPPTFAVLLNNADPVTEIVFANVAAPVTPTVFDKVVAPVTPKVFDKVAAPVTAKVLLKVAAPVALIVLPNVVAPVTFNEPDASIFTEFKCHLLSLAPNDLALAVGLILVSTSPTIEIMS